ncbi:PEP-CTERM/exosortase system-associated acyltransferase [Colwellia sp. Bg11-28]|jgi:N-acyl amino acid synthase of PEP-CTERM/exosortase system|uniref:PEP-CTERM/exosortase system-associated acyltransferase n=1 Tax=Colwellia sp. Bg11-28 TaxID=2058305 RepID=UPI000C329BB4|nr:PEP-CTERM/exosortase system-associated acyltransferase [Colwellia sp. Bg11-28]PKH85561.1 PEP-CTERM/exosortase system-associated acyltransferase [Colwellia sp. Bg11-28]
MNWNKRLLDTPIIGNITKKIVSAKASREAHNISDHFTQFLQPCVAVSQTLKEEAFKIRHNVYCEELAFEEIRENGQETDEFDHQSMFSLIKHKPSGTFTSCVRLVTSSGPDELLPIEKYCLDSITNEELSPKHFNRNEIAEISRLAVKSDFRRRKADNYKGSGTGVISEITYSETELRCFPFIAIGLYMAAATMSMNTGIRHVYVMMEPRLARSMKFIGINFQQLGPPVDYHGLRAPYYINPEIFMKNLSPGFKSLFSIIEEDICSQLNQLDLA